MDFLVIGSIIAFVAFATIVLITMMVLRRVVPTNMVHIVQSTKHTTAYGKDRVNSGNTYYAIPSWVPVYGVSVLEFPESIFKVNLNDYEAYDSARLPFMVDVTAFFRVDHAETAAQRVFSFAELVEQLDSVLKGAVRRILAKNALEEIMEARSSLGQQFTEEVTKQIKEWGVTTVKTIEFMDIRDSKAANSKVIHNIMAKEQARIDRESRIVVADNRKNAELAEIDAAREVDVQRQDALQQIGIRTAEKDKTVGRAQEIATQEVLEEGAKTAEKTMAVKRVEEERKADIEKQVKITQAVAAREVQITQASAERESLVLRSEGELVKTTNDAKGVLLQGEATAKAEELILLAPVIAQIQLAKEIGENDNYQEYLVKVEQIRASQAVGTTMAESIGKADLKVISNGGHADVMNGVSSIADVFSTKGGTSLTGMMAALSQTPEGKALVGRITGTLQ